MLMRVDPFRDLESVAQLLARQSAAPRNTPMAMDAYRDGDQFVVVLDLPGVDRDSIDITVERNEVTIEATRQWEPTENQQVIVAERPQGSFTRQFYLGENLDPDALTASYDDGVLGLTIPVAERSKPRKIAITNGERAD
jgi:HSP20 family protein